MALRFTPSAAAQYRASIAEADGVEVFAIGDITDGEVVEVTVVCRGTEDAVPALMERPRGGQVVIHNHPSGDLRPSQADFHLAGRYGDNGVGVVITDNEVTRSNWVVEPYEGKSTAIDREALRAFFEVGLPAALEDHESRPAQVDMANGIADMLDHATPLVVEAGTGTGKSLAYLVPAALWALANDSKVVISTYTRTLQGQLLGSDLPLLAAGGIKVETHALLGRNNYLCKRRANLAFESTEKEDPERTTLELLAQWSRTSDGNRVSLPMSIEPGLWDRVLSDTDLTLRTRCPHYATCHYYTARRKAASAHLIVVNHALLLADLKLKAEAGVGILPKFDRVIIDEGHHLEDAATSATSDRLTALAVRRAVLSLLDRKRAKGSLTLLHRAAKSGPKPVMSGPALDMLGAQLAHLVPLLEGVAGGVATSLDAVADALISDDIGFTRVTPRVESSDTWRMDAVPTLKHLASELEEAAEQLGAVEEKFDDTRLPPDRVQPLLDLVRAKRRLTGAAGVVRRFLAEEPDVARWVGRGKNRANKLVVDVSVAPVDVAETLRSVLWRPISGVAATSATMTVASRFGPWRARHGLDESTEVMFASPFDYPEQALLALPRDLPAPNDERFMEETTRCIKEAVAISDGGAFVLCTSYRAVRAYSAALRASSDRPVLAQGETGRAALLDRFRANPRAVLVGTDSFWEGVSVKGEALRLVIIPRIPFRVPTDPLQAARVERIEKRGGDPFRTYSLPQAVLKLRQGFGRLIRSKSDRGVVLLLDRRVHDRSYGTIVLRSLPPARRITGPWRRVRQELLSWFVR